MTSVLAVFAVTLGLLGSFVFWTFLFSTAVNLIRFIPKDRPVTYYFPESLQWMQEFLGWMPAAAAPLLAMGFIGFGWQYGRDIVRGVKSFFSGAYNVLRGRRKPDETPRSAEGCALFFVDSVPTSAMCFA